MVPVESTSWSSALFSRRRRPSPHALVALTALCAALCATLGLAWDCAAASAATKRLVQGLFGALSSPQGVAVDQSTGHPTSGDVYVADAGNHRVQQFTGEGAFVLMFGKNVNKLGGLEPDVCRAGEECQPGTGGSGAGAFETPEFVAVDNDSSSSSFRDVYVADVADGIVSKWTPAGATVESWGTKGQLNGSTTKAKSFGEIAGIDVSANGTLYVLNTSDEVFEFEPSGKPLGEVQLETEFSGVAAHGFVVGPKGQLFKVTPGGSIIEFTAAGGEVGLVNVPGVTAQAFAGSPSGDLYFVTEEAALAHVEFNGAEEVLEPEGSCPVAPGAGCAPTDSSPAGFVGSGVAVEAASGDTVLSNPAQGREWLFGPLVVVPDVKTEGASEVGPRSVTLNGFVNPDGVEVTKCEFEIVEAAKYEPEATDPYGKGSTAPCAEPPGSGEGEAPVHAEVSGLIPGVTYDFRLLAANKNDEGAPQRGEKGSVQTLPPPSISATSVSGMTGETAVLNVSIDPHGTETHYRFEYDTRPYAPGEGAHGTEVPAGEGTIAGGEGPVSESAAISGLHADTQYYWRVVATNESGTTVGPQHSFIYSTAGSGLPDNRAYELVTPNLKNASLIGDVSAFGGGITDVASNGGRVIAETIQCFEGAESCNGKQGDSVGSPYEFVRTSGGWVTHPLAPSASVFSTSATWGYSALEDTVLFTAPSEPSGEPDFYVRSGSGALADVGPNTDPAGGPAPPTGGLPAGEKDAFSSGFSHVAWETQANWPGLEEGGSPEKVYEYAGTGNARPLLVGVTGAKGSPSLVSECGTELGVPSNGKKPNEMSADGQTVFFLARKCATGTGENAGTPVPADTLYARVDGEEPLVGGKPVKPRTVALSAPSPSECGTGAGAGEVSCRGASPSSAGFEGASEDGSKAFFVSTQQLTAEASEDGSEADKSIAAEEECAKAAGANGCNLYEYDFAQPSGHELVDASAGDVSGGGPRVRGVVALAPDGSHVYFVAGGVLTTAANAFAQKAVPGAENLYMFERDAAFPAGRTVFIATLPEADHKEWVGGPGDPANVSGDGQFLVFLSSGQLTPDDTSVSEAQQVFRYDAATGRLSRVSIGEQGFEDDGNRAVPSPCNAGQGCSEDARIAIPAARSDVTLAKDGSRVFFESPLALTRGAADDVQISVNGEGGPVYARNVYEWEQEGVGSCPVGEAAGCVYLISRGWDLSVNAGATAICLAEGNQVSSVCLLGTDESGDDVFFSTSEALTAADTNTELDYYDARVCEPESPCVQAARPPGPGCGGEQECRGLPGGAPGVPQGGSLARSGSGNYPPVKPGPKVITRHQHLVKALRACRVEHQHSRRRRAACERVAQRRWGAKKAKKASKSAGRAKRSSRGRSGGAR